MTCTVVCVLRSGAEYVPDHVRKLYEGVKKYWPTDQLLRFVALTDIPIHTTGIEERPLCYGWNGWWSKMELFERLQDDLGDILYFDLDTIIVEIGEPLMQPRPLTLLQDFYHPERLQSGMMYLPLEDRPQVSEAFLQDPQGIMSWVRGDGEFLDFLLRGKAAVWQVTAGEFLVVSYKCHVRQRKGQTIPPDARVVCFHGRPRPWATPLWDCDL
jgi:hypothetical protein